MEKATIINEQQLQNIKQITEGALISLDAAGMGELLCALVLPLLALLIGILFSRWVSRRASDSINAKLLDFIAPLMAPFLATLFVMLAGFIFRHYEVKLFILPFVWKLTVAWFAIRLVAMMSSRQSAGWLIALVIVPITLMHLFDVWDPVTDALKEAKFTFGTAKLNAYGILKSAAAIIGLFWVAKFIVSATDTRLRRVRSLHVSNRVLIMKFFQIFLYFIAFLIGLQMLGVDLTAFSVLGGALGVGIGFGLQKIASNFISGIILLFEKSVSVDDLVMLADGTTGFIRQTAARYTLLETTDGREIFIPNEEFITQQVTTLTHTSKRGRVEIPVGVAYDSDLKLALDTLMEAALAHERCMADPAPAAFVTTFADSSINLVLYFWVENVADGRLGPKSDVMQHIVKLFNERGISIPYPHQVQIADAAMEARLEHIEQQLETLGRTAPAAAPKSKKKPASGE